MPWLHTPADVTALIERALGERRVALARHEHGISNAVWFVALAGGAEVVVRVSERRFRASVELEAWAFARCEAAGVPVPELLTAEVAPTWFPEPYLITRRVTGLLGDSAALTIAQLLAAYRDLGRCLARLHRLPVAGFGGLILRAGAGFAGRYATSQEAIAAELALLAGWLPPDERPQRYLERARTRIATNRALLDRPTAALLHGDVQGKNLVIDPAAGGRVAALLDFECAEGGDPALDFRVVHYWDSRRDALRAAMLAGYVDEGGGDEVGPGTAILTRIRLFELLYALQRLASAYERPEPIDADEAYRRLDRIEATLADT
jgi:aminoglycoside phosphotransferase (APT) family kinase protein